MTQALTYVEIDTPPWIETSPPGDLVTWRFAMATDGRPHDIDAIPSLVGADISPLTISLGQNLGQRANVTCSFRDHRHIMDGEPFDSGSFWGKFRSRYGLRLRGKPLRVIRGSVGQTLAEMETRHFIIEANDGPSPAGGYSISARDILKAADADRAQAPRPSTGYLVNNITISATTFTLSPSGIGNFEYPASGHVCIAGNEVVSFTRVGDVMTVVRGALGSVASAHNAEDRAQLVLRYDADDPAEIVRDLLTEYADVDPSTIDLAAWLSETQTYFNRLLSAVICEPVSVNTLVSEIIETAALAVWWDDVGQQIRLRVLRPIVTDAQLIDRPQQMVGTLSTGEQPGARVSQVWTYYGRRNPTRPMSELSNYRSIAITPDLEAETEYGGAAIKKFYSRWVPAFGRSIALRLNDIHLGRFVNPPRKFGFSVFARQQNVVPGGGYRLGWFGNQNMDGSPAYAPIQVTRVSPKDDRLEITAEEMLFTNFDPGNSLARVITIDTNSLNLDLLAVHNSLFPPVDPGASPQVTVLFIVAAGVNVGSANTATPALKTGVWPGGFSPTLRVLGRVQGAGGAGGSVGTAATNAGKLGGLALHVENPLALEDATGQIWGGGGGGSGAVFNLGGGGGGAGNISGAGGSTSHSGTGTPGTSEAGGSGFNPGSGTGSGGNPGLPGQSGSSPGGAAGGSVLGVSLVTTVGAPGDRRGSQTG